MSEAFDLLVIGGGINGAGIARDAAGRGLKVLLCDKGDLAGATSSASSKMIHGGLRYLEHGAFRLVRAMRFVLPHGPGLRQAGCCAPDCSFTTGWAARGRCRARPRSICATAC